MVKKLLIKDLLNSEPIKDALRICRKKVGSTHEIDAEENQIMIDFIKKRFGSIYTTDIIEAFDLAIDGRFEYIKPSDLAPLKTRFTQAFLSQIMNPYLSYRAERSRSQQREDKKIEPPKEWSPKKLIEMYNKTIEGDYQFQGMEYIFYKKLEQYGIEVMPVKEKRELFEEMKTQVPKRMREHEDDWLDRVAIACKKSAFKTWIMNHVMEETDLEKLLKELITKK